MKHSMPAALLAAALSVALAACGSKPAPSTEAADVGKKPSLDNAQQDAQQALTAKLNDYVECYNRVDSGIQAGMERYAGWMDDLKAGPQGKEKHPFGPTRIDSSDLESCQQEVARAAAAKPAAPALDAAGKAYLESLQTLAPLANDAADYYERDDYEDDAYARGKQMHAPLMAALSEFSAASEAFGIALESENDKAQRAQLAEMEKAGGRDRNYYHLAMMLEAKETLDLMAREGFDVAAGAEHLATFNKISDEAHAKVGKDGDASGWSTFEAAAERFRKQAKERLARVRDNRPFDKYELMANPNGPDGSPERLLAAYNEMVSRGNVLQD